MKTIKFANRFPKLHNQKTATLLMALTDLPENVLRNKYSALWLYDTLCDNGTFYQSWRAGQNFILLLFLGDMGIMFPTLRTDNEENRNKYCESIGEIFNIEVEEHEQ